MIGICTLSQHPNQMKPPGGVFKFDKFFPVVRMNFNSQVILRSQFKQRFVFLIKNTSPCSDAIHKVGGYTKEVHSQFFDTSLHFPKCTSNESGMNHKSGSETRGMIVVNS